MDRLTIPEAARRLGITDAAVRKRYERGTLEGEKGGDGRIYVFVDTGDTERPSEASIVEILRDEIAHLRRESERKDAILMSLSQANAEQARTIRALEAPQEPPEAAETVEQEPEEAEPQSAPAGAQEGVHTTAPNASRALPLWKYVIGIILAGTTEFLLLSSYSFIVRPIFGAFVPESVLLVATIVLPLLIPIAFGFWVGRNYKGSNLWARLGATVVLITLASLLLTRILIDIIIMARGGTPFFPSAIGPSIWTVPVGVAFISGALIGYAWRRRLARQAGGTAFSRRTDALLILGSSTLTAVSTIIAAFIQRGGG